MANTNALGAISEAMVLAEFLKAGFPVLMPFSGNSRYDMAVEAGGRLLRVQCKTASRCGWKGSGACLCFHARSIRYQAGRRIEKSYRGQADLFAAYAAHTKQVYVLEVDEVPETDVRLRLANPLTRRTRRKRHLRTSPNGLPKPTSRGSSRRTRRRHRGANHRPGHARYQHGRARQR